MLLSKCGEKILTKKNGLLYNHYLTIAIFHMSVSALLQHCPSLNERIRLSHLESHITLIGSEFTGSLEPCGKKFLSDSFWNVRLCP